MLAIKPLFRLSGCAGIAVAMHIFGFLCTNNPIDIDNDYGQIDGCLLEDSIVYDSAFGPYTFTCPLVYINGAVTLTAGTQASIKGCCEITWTGTLTIEQGARLFMDEGACILVNGGRLNINGTKERPVLIKNSETGTYWGPSDKAIGGICFDSSASRESSIAWCDIDSAISGISSDEDSLSITNTTIRNAQHNGIIFYESGPADSAHFTGNAFIHNGSGNSDYPLIIDAANLIRLAGDGVFTDNSQQAINVHCQGRGNLVAESGTWRKHPVPYVFSDHYAYLDDSSGVTITIQPGTRLLFQEESYIVIGRGALIARGTAADSIFFGNRTAGVRWGFEAGLQFTVNSQTSSAVQYCHITSATENGIFLNVNPATVSNSTIDNCERYGIYMFKATSSVNVDLGTITFSGNGVGGYVIDD
jgi:hypothetical protein